MATAGTTADDADFAGVVGLGLEPFRGCAHIADHLVVGNAAVGADLAGDVVGAAVADTAVQVGADGHIAVAGDAAGELLIELVPAGHVVDDDDAWVGAAARRAG